MSREHRRHYIISQLKSRGFITIDDVVRHFPISKMTVRRDLNELENQRLLVRTHGGAALTDTAASLFSFQRRSELHREQKKLICSLAAAEINHGDTVFVDCGSTPYYLAEFLMDKEIRIITNSLPIASLVLRSPTAKLTFVGGAVDKDRQASYGRTAEKQISEIIADKAFIGSDGVSLKNGLSSFDEKEGAITAAMAVSARKVYLLCDHSKFERDSYYRFGGWDLIHTLVSDVSQEHELYQSYTSAGITMLGPDHTRRDQNG